MSGANRILNISPGILLLNEDQVPPHMREVAILSGYRSPKSSVKQCAFSIFVATNETLNFWTHFIPTLYFMWQLATFWDILRVISDPYTWPFAAYMVTICLYPLISALAHTFYSISEFARHIWFFLDYGSLSFYAFGVGLLYKAYVFPIELQRTIFGTLFLEFLVVLTLLCTFLSCYSRFINNLFWIKVFRLGAFAIPWTWSGFPLFYRLVRSTDIDSDAAEHYWLQFFFSFLIGFFYASHLPERLAPGKFDFVGNSHQLLHISGILATHEQMSGALIDMNTRHETLANNSCVLPDYWPLQVFATVFFGIAVTILCFVWVAKCDCKNDKLKES